MFRYAGRIAARRIHHQDAAPSGGLQIDVIHAHARASDHAQLRRMAQQFIGHARGAAHDQRIGLVELLCERSRRGLHDLPAGFCEQFDTVFTDAVSNDNFHGPRAYRPCVPLSNADSRLPAKPCEIKLALGAYVIVAISLGESRNKHPWRSSTAFKKSSPKP